MAGMFYEIVPGYGYCLNVDDAHDTIRIYQEQTQNRYCVTNASSNFGSIDVKAKLRKIFWEDDQKNKVTRECLMYDGVPFHILGKKVFACEYGKNKNLKKDADGNIVTKRSTSKKVNCPALIYMKEVIKYPGYMVEENCPLAKSNMAEKLRSDYSKGIAEGQRRFYIVFPNIKEHENHVVYYDGKLVNPEDIPCEENELSYIQYSDSIASDDLTSQPSEIVYLNNAHCCRAVIEKLRKKIMCNPDNSEMLSDGEVMLKEILDFMS